MKVQQSFGREFMSYFQGPPLVTEPLAPGGPIRHWDGNLDVPPGVPGAAAVVDSAAAGSISAGTHNLVVFFEMTYGTLSAQGAAVTWTAAGNLKAVVSNIPIGPNGCVARRIAITTVADPNTYLFLPSFKVNDNVTTSFTIDGSDLQLQHQGYPLSFPGSILSTLPSIPTLAPLAPDGPGSAPAVIDDTTPYTPVNIATASEIGSVATYTTVGPHGFLVGQTIVVAGVGVGGYNVTAAIASIPSPNSFTFTLGVNSLANSGGGTATLTGSISIGVHQVQVVWETRWGFLSAPSPTVQWTAAGGFGATVFNLPIGPWYVIARRILVTLSGGADFFYITQNRIGDNTSTTARIDFTDTILAAGSNFNYLARNFSPMESYGIGAYGGRLVTWGGLNTLKATNLGFDGGWNFADGTPMGWTQGASPVLFSGGSREIVNVFCGEAWRILGSGFSDPRGQIYNPTVQPLLQPNTSYTVSFRAQVDSLGSTGSLVVDLWSPTVGLLSPSVVVDLPSQLTLKYQEFQGILLNGLAAIPSDTVLRVYSNGFVAVGVGIYIDHIRIWPTQQKYEASVVRFSNPLDPETFDGVNGFIQISKDDGQQVVACTQLRSFFYILKERSWHTTYDDGTNPPSLWFTRAVDRTIGAASPNGITSSDTYLVSFWRSGAYMYAGGKPTKVSQEIQPTWTSFNWSAAWTTHVLLDTQNKQIFFFGPMNGLTQPQSSLVLDYSEGIGQEDDPAGRKWGLDAWPVPVNGSFLFENDNNTQSIYLVGPKLYEHTGTDDDGTPIDSFYETAFVKAGDHGQDVFLGCSYFAEGNGKIIVTMSGVDGVIVDVLPKNVVLTANPGQQFEMYGNLESERAKLRFEMLADNAQFVIKGVTLYAQPNYMDQRPQ